MTQLAIRAATPADRAMLDALIAASYAALDDGLYDRAAQAAGSPSISTI